MSPVRRRQFRRMSPRLGVVLGLAAAGVVAALLHGWDGGQSLVGRATAVDGDTLRLSGARIRLVGLDAPELEQDCTDAAGGAWPCGREAKTFLAGLLSQGETACQTAGQDAYRRKLARCTVAGADLGRSVVAAGWAVTSLDYAGAEASARESRRGIWQGSFTAPADWRRSRGGEPGWWEWLRAWFG